MTDRVIDSANCCIGWLSVGHHIQEMIKEGVLYAVNSAGLHAADFSESAACKQILVSAISVLKSSDYSVTCTRDFAQYWLF